MGDEREAGRAEAKAFRLLALRAHSEKELRVKLRAGGFVNGVIERVVRRCRELGYLDDGSFARQRARALAVGRLAGDRRIVLDLRQKGIGEDLCRQAIEEVRGELDEREAAERLIRKKTRGRLAIRLDEREKAALARHLAGKGFPTGLILSLLNEAGEEGFHDDDGE